MPQLGSDINLQSMCKEILTFLIYKNALENVKCKDWKSGPVKEASIINCVMLISLVIFCQLYEWKLPLDTGNNYWVDVLTFKCILADVL